VGADSSLFEKAGDPVREVVIAECADELDVASETGDADGDVQGCSADGMTVDGLTVAFTVQKTDQRLAENGGIPSLVHGSSFTVEPEARTGRGRSEAVCWSRVTGVAASGVTVRCFSWAVPATA
jgi:hypothetical protein